MSPKEEYPCQKGLTAECFEKEPAWAKQAFAYKLLYLLFPPEITKKLPTVLARALIAPGVIIPPGVEIPPGTVIGPGAVIPTDWTPDLPMFPGGIPPPTLPPGMGITGPVAPTFVGTGEAGPTKAPAPGGGLQTVEVNITGSDDGRYGYQDATWATCYGATSSNWTPAPETETDGAVWARYTGMLYRIVRAFISFDLSAIPAGAIVTICTIRLRNYGTPNCDVTIQEGTQGSPLSWLDYDAFTGSYFDLLTWGATYNSFTLNTAGIAYIQSVVGGTAKVCLREHVHDYLNSAPGAAEDWQAGLYWSGAAQANRRPRMTLTYQI